LLKLKVLHQVYLKTDYKVLTKLKDIAKAIEKGKITND